MYHVGYSTDNLIAMKLKCLRVRNPFYVKGSLEDVTSAEKFGYIYKDTSKVRLSL